jgi:SAM-dependent methyltransferase
MTALAWAELLWQTGRAGRYYDLLGAPKILASPAGDLMTNMGLWRGALEGMSLHAANAALVEEVVRGAGVAPGARVLDVGCGTGYALRRVASMADTRSLVGINSSRRQLELARVLLDRSPHRGRITFVHGDACDLPFPDASVDLVIAIEAGFHFGTRRRFFEEASRVLAPGGRIALADLVLLPPVSMPQRMNAWALRRGLQIPAENFGSVGRFKADLRAAGFSELHLDDVTAEVIPPWQRWFFQQPLRERLAYPLPAVSFTFGFFVYPRRYLLAWAVRGPGGCA